MSTSSFRGDNYFLSNFYPCNVKYKNLVYRSSEAAYQAQKFGNKQIFVNMTAEEAKRYATTHTSDVEGFDADKLNIMKEILYCKFTQNEELRQLLINTEESLIEYNDWGDTFWGKDMDTKEGDNQLGSILMDIRYDLQSRREKIKIEFGSNKNHGDRLTTIKFYGSLYRQYGEYAYGNMPDIGVLTNNESSYGIVNCFIRTRGKRKRKSKFYWWEGIINTSGLIVDPKDDDFWPIEHMIHGDDIDSILLP